MLSRSGNRLISLAVTMFYALNWRVLATNLCGLETPLAVLILLLILDYLFRLNGAQLARTRTWVYLGLLFAAGVYARFDFLLFAVLAGGYAACLSLSNGIKVTFVNAVALGGVVLVALLPWFSFSMTVSGTLLPNSREAVRLLSDGGLDFSTLKLFLSTFYSLIFAGIHWASDNANLMGVWPTVLPEGRLSQLAALFLALFVVWVFVSAIRARHVLPQAIWLCMLFFLAHCAYYLIEYRLEVRYVLPAYAALIVLLGLVLGGADTRPLWVKREHAAALVFAMFLISTVSGIQAWTKYQGTTRTHQGHGDLLQAALWIQSTVPDARVGAWNAGILSYFSRAEVVNLDGVINDSALAANRVNEIDRFIVTQGITYLADVKSQIEGYLASTSTGMALVGETVATFGDVVVVEVRPEAVE